MHGSTFEFALAVTLFDLLPLIELNFAFADSESNFDLMKLGELLL